MEEWLLDFLKVGVLPLVGVFGGLAWSGRREKQNRQNDQERDDKNSQRTAVANFIRAIEDLDVRSTESWAEWLSLNPEEKRTWEKTNNFLVESFSYFNKYMTEISILDLHLHDPFVRKRLESLKEALNESGGKYKRRINSAMPIKVASADREEALSQLAESIAIGLDRSKITPRFYELIEEARVRLRLKNAGGDDHPPMFTPPS